MRSPCYGNTTDFRVLAFALLYGLSIVVRYRPSIWRRVAQGDADQYKALTRSFLDVVDRVLPQDFLARIIGHDVHTAQPNTFA